MAYADTSSGSVPQALGADHTPKATSMDILEQIVQSEVDVIYGPVVRDIYDKFNHAMETLTHICHTDPHFSHVISPNELTSPFHLRETGTQNILELVQPQPVRRVLHVHSPSVVLKDWRTEWKKDCPLLFYVSGLECTRSDHVKVFLSARTHGQMMRGSFGVTFVEESTPVLPDEHETPKFFLSSQAFQNNFTEQMPNFLCCHKSILGVLDRSKLRDTPCRIGSKEKGIPFISSDIKITEIYALKSIPALLHPEWPVKGLSFLSRQRKSGWPSCSLLKEVSSVGCHLIPAPNSGSEEKNGDGSTTEWQLNFYAAEKLLLQTLSIVDKQAALVFSCLVCDRHTLNRGVVTMDHIKTIILWTLEDHPMPAQGTKNPLLTRFIQICEKFMCILSSGCCRHYFIPERNLFDDVPMKLLEDIRDMVDCLLDQPWTLILHSYLLPYSFYDQKNHLESLFYSDSINDEVFVQNTLEKFQTWTENIKHQLRDQVRDSLLATFNDTALLYVLTSCARMNSCSVDESIILHRDMLRMVQDASVGNVLYLPYIDVVSTNLASLYQVKALTVSGKREKEYFLIKSEAMMRASKNMDICLGRTRLANLLYSMRRYQEAAQELDELLQVIDVNMTMEVQSNDNDGSDDGADGNDERVPVVVEEFRDALWRKWLKKEYLFDIMYNCTLLPMCPPTMKQSLSLTLCSTLGIQRHSVAIFSPVFHSRFLLALCHAGMRCPEQALPILHGLAAVLMNHKLVKTLETSHFSEVSEKRIAGYYIVLGNCYSALQEQEMAKEAFLKAMQVFPTPRNPASLLYMGVKYGDTISGIQQGVKLLAVATALSLAVNYVSSQI